MKQSFGILLFAFPLLVFLLSACNEDDINPVDKPSNGLNAIAGNDKTVNVNAVVVLDGSLSSDTNEKPFSFQWIVKSRPAASIAIIENSNQKVASLKPDVAGSYVVELIIRQGEWVAKDEIIIHAAATDPHEPMTVALTGEVNHDLTLTDIITDPTQPDYLVTGDVTVRANLVIEPGVTIFFEQNKGMQIVNGSIHAKGMENQPIILRGVSEAPGFWKGIEILSNANENVIEYALIKDAGSAALPESGATAAVVLAGTAFSGSALKMSQTTISGSNGFGLAVLGSSSIENLSNMKFQQNSSSVYLPASQLGQVGEGNEFIGNGFNGIETSGEVSNGPATWKNIQPYSYRVTGDITIRDGVTIQPGTKIEMKKNVGIKILDNGSLNATGTESARIIFTAESVSDRWNGLYFNTQSPQNKLIYTEISSGGNSLLGDAAELANIAVGNGGQLVLEQSIISNGGGYGLVAKYYYQINENVAQVNTFTNLAKGVVLPRNLMFPDRPAIIGDWVDQWSLNKGLKEINTEYFSTNTTTWFSGASSPWTINNGKATGIRIQGDGRFTWAIAEPSPMTGCESWSAEYITGTVSVTEETITFHQDFWRSKFINACQPDQNVDMEVTPSDITVRYEYDKLYNLLTGEMTWVLKFTNPDGSTFALYQK